MRKLSIFLTAALLVLSGGSALAQDKPTEESPSAPGSEPVAPDSVSIFPEKVVLSQGGRTVDAAAPGVAVRVTVTLRNNGSKALGDVRGHLAQIFGGSVTDGDATYGDIPAEGTADGAFTITADKEGCEDYLGVLMNISFDGGSTATKFAVPVACPGPRLAVEDVKFEGGDGDGVPEPGETIRAFIVLRNNGRDAAKAVRATVKVSGKGIPPKTDDLAWDDIAPNGSERSTTPIVFSIPLDAPRQDACEGPPVAVIPPEEGGTAAKDTPVSSDGNTVSSDGGNVSSEPGSSAGLPGSGGGSEPTVVEPDPGTAEPEPGTGTPVPMPDPVEPEPQPTTTDRAAYVEMHLETKATDYAEGIDYSNGTVCAAREGSTALGAPVDAVDLKRDAGFTNATPVGGTAVPLAIVVLAALSAVGARKLIVG